MRSIVLLPVFAALMLAGCGSKPSVEAKNESAESVAGKVAASGLKPRPGQWESQIKIEKMAMGNMPAAAQEAMNKQLGATRSHLSCLTQEQVDRPNASFFQGAAANCTYEHFTMADGKIDAKMTCQRGPGQQTMTMVGTYDPENYNVKVNSQAAMRQGMQMDMTMSISSHRVGECTGKEG